MRILIISSYQQCPTENKKHAHTNLFHTFILGGTCIWRHTVACLQTPEDRSHFLQRYPLTWAYILRKIPNKWEPFCTKLTLNNRLWVLRLTWHTPIQTKSVYPSQVFYANFQDVCKATDIPLSLSVLAFHHMDYIKQTTKSLKAD